MGRQTRNVDMQMGSLSKYKLVMRQTSTDMRAKKRSYLLTTDPDLQVAHFLHIGGVREVEDCTVLLCITRKDIDRCTRVCQDRSHPESLDELPLLGVEQSRDGG